MDYATDIRQLLTDHGIKQTDLARELGITNIAVSKALNGGTMTDTTYHRYREALLALIVEKQQQLPDELTINGVTYRKVRKNNENDMEKKEKPITEMTCPHCGNRTKLARWHLYNNVSGEWMCECPICKNAVEGLPSE